MSRPVRTGSGPALIDLSDAAYWREPHRFLREARAQHPVALASTGEPIVLRYRDVDALASDPRMISNALAFVESQVESGPLVDWWRLMLTNLNGRDHVRLRGLVSRAFTPRRVDEKRPRIRALTRELLERHADAGEFDILHDFSHELPIRLICELLGVPEAHHEEFSRWSTNLGAALSSVITPELRAAGEEAASEMSAAVRSLLKQRRAAPEDDLLSALIGTADEMDDRFSDDDLLVLVINLIFGGHDSSRSMLAIALAMFLANPDQCDRLRADPKLAARAGEEVLRVEPIVPVLSREPTEDLEVAGLPLPAGRPVLLSILSANRDPEVFPDPDRFDITRDAARSFSFGWGVHHCLGAALARAEIQEVVPEFFSLCSEVEMLIDAPEWVPFANLRRIERLPVRFEMR